LSPRSRRELAQARTAGDPWLVSRIHAV
jgi:hypothetical protein